MHIAKDPAQIEVALHVWGTFRPSPDEDRRQFLYTWRFCLLTFAGL